MKKRRVHLAHPATATEILRSLRVSKKDMKIVRQILDKILGLTGRGGDA